ncbi:MAG: cell division protein [Holophagaceae bacterium]|nr:cell division protein [Holophagaceae bacterium]
MTPLRLLAILLRDVVRDLLRHRGQHALVILTLASGLLLAGGGLLAVESLNRWVSRMESMAKVTIFASEGGHLDETEAALRRDPRFRRVQRVSAKEATTRFLASSREAGLLLESLGGEALPESLELDLRPDLVSEHRAIEVGESLRQMPGVGDVVVDHERLAALQGFARLVRSAVSLLGVVLLLAAGFTTGNVIRMSILSREEEISIMRLVGASEGFIRTPLLLEGAFLGLAASAFAVLALFAVWLPIQRGLWGLPPLFVEMARLGFFSLRSVVLLGSVGTLTGALGALWGFWSTQRAQRRMAALDQTPS